MTSIWLDDVEPIQSDPLPAGAGYDIVVVGAGFTGLTTALLLARAGQRVAVLEARHVGAVTSGNTTAKLSVLQGTKLSAIGRHHSSRLVQAYVDGNLEGQQWLLRYCEDNDVPVQLKTAFTYANTAVGAKTVRKELAAARQAGLDAQWVDELDLPFSTHGAVSLAGQAQFDPMDVMTTLASDLRAHGGFVHEGVRVQDVQAGNPCTIDTSAGQVRAAHVVLATGIPILDRGLYFAKLHPERSYCIAYDGVGNPPDGMFLSADAPSRSLRTFPRRNGSTLLIVGGSGHGVGRAHSPEAHLDELREWTTEHFPGARETHRWSAQDYSSADHVPFVGKLPRGKGRIHLATGFEKWGMTNSVAAALTMSAEILGGSIPWAKTLGHRVTGPLSLAKGAQFNAQVGALMGAGWAGSALRSAPATPAEGDGKVGRRHGRPVAVSTVDGRTCALSAICPHLGGIVSWNDAEKSWDCPLHGSRFAVDGTILEGPATRGLSPVEDETAS